VTNSDVDACIEIYKFESMEVNCKTGQKPFTRLNITKDGVSITTEAEGSGPVDAVFKAIENIADSQSELELYSVNAVTAGTEALGDVIVRLSRDGQIVNGVGADTDVVAASAKAYIAALNLLESGAKSHPQHQGV